jgi:hypothetical protein
MRLLHWHWGWAIGSLLLGLNLMIVVGPVQWPLSAQEPKRFVYKVIDMPGNTHVLQTALNEHGSGGWEIVAVETGQLQVQRVIFKK